MDNKSHSITFIIPCKDEEYNIGNVIKDCFKYLPNCSVIVCDNCCKDNTAKEAENAGAQVIFENRLGKGHAVRRLINVCDSDIIIMIDGDNTYDVSSIPSALRKFIAGNYDVASANRLVNSRGHNRFGHYFGNIAFNKFASVLLGRPQYDLFSGLFIFKKEFLLTFPLFSNGFEIEAELATHIARMDSRFFSFPMTLRSRIIGKSKLNTISDSLRILSLLLKNSTTEFPLRVFTPLAFITLILSIIFCSLPITEYFLTGFVTYFPRLIVGTGLLIVSIILILTGIILYSLCRNRIESRIFISRILDKIDS